MDILPFFVKFIKLLLFYVSVGFKKEKRFQHSLINDKIIL